MSHVKCVRLTTVLASMTFSALGVVVMSSGGSHGQAGASSTAQSPFPAPPPDSPAGPVAYSCGVPATPPTAPAAGRGLQPTFPAGQYPVKLPPVSLLGARNDLPNPYQAGRGLGSAASGRKWGSTASVTTAPDGTIWVIDRCGNSGAGGTTCGGPSAGVNPIFQFDTSGKLLKTFGAGMFVSPHKLTVDKDGYLWVADNGSHQVFKLDQDGKVLMTLGKKGIAGPGLDEFDAPTEVAIAPNGDIFVADGHTGGGTAVGNARIMKFDKTGKFIKTWGKKGMGPGEFDVLHTLAFDSRGRLFVGDRQNNRIQIFDQDGKFIAQWFQFGRPSGMYIDKRTDTLYVADSESRDGANQHRTIRSAADRVWLQSRDPPRDQNRERQRRFGQILDSRSVPLSLCGGVEPCGRRHRGSGGQRVWCGFPHRCEEVRQEMNCGQDE